MDKLPSFLLCGLAAVSFSAGAANDDGASAQEKAPEPEKEKKEKPKK